MSEAAAPGGIGLPAGPARLLSDERLVRRATSGDERAFAAIFRRYHQDLYRFCLAIVGEPQDAQDALQNTMVKVMRALPGEQRQIRLKPWLYRIAHNESVEVLRHRVPADPIDLQVAATAPGPAEEAEQRARLRRLVADMGELPERQRGALVMRELAGLDFEEIGAAFGASPAVARQTLYEARLGLRQMEEGRELSCDEVMRAISDADGRVTRRRDLRAHLRECGACREFAGEMRRRHADFAAIAPLPAVAAAGILQGIVGVGGSGGAAAAGAAGGTVAGKALGGSALGGSVLAKSAVTVAVVAVIGVKVADRGGLVDVGLPGGGSKDSPADTRPGNAPAGQPRLAPRTPAKADAEGGGSAKGVGGGAAASKPEKGGGQGASAAGEPAGSGTTHAPGKAPAAPAAPGASDAHRQDSGRHGNPPSAADHGQETAASHKGGASAPGQQGGNPSPPKKGQGNGNGNGAGQGNGSGAAPKEHPAHPQKPEPAPAPEPPPKPGAPPGPEAAGGGKPAPPPETPAGSHSAPPGLD